MVKFERSALVATFPTGVRAPVAASGSIGAEVFVGNDTVEVATDEQPLAVDLLPKRVELSPIAPHPAVGRAVIRFALPFPAEVQLELFDVQGRRILVLARGPQAAGWHSVSWQGMDGSGRRVPAGIYAVRMRVAEFTFTRRLVLIR